LGGTAAKYTLIHVVETVGAMLYGENIDDHELVDEELLKDYGDEKFNVAIQLGFGL
jgi:manganese transport protein